MCAGQAKPGFRCSILLYKLVRYAFPAMCLVFGIYPKRIGRWAGTWKFLSEILVDHNIVPEKVKKKNLYSFSTVHNSPVKSKQI